MSEQKIKNVSALLAAKHNKTPVRLEEDQQTVETGDSRAHEECAAVRSTSDAVCEMVNRKMGKKKRKRIPASESLDDIPDIFDMPAPRTPVKVKERSSERGILGLLSEDA